MNWISVKERLPEDKQKVIFKGGFPYECKGFFEINESGSHFYNLIESTGKIYSIYGVTHWMELPEKPSVTNDEMVSKLRDTYKIMHEWIDNQT